MLQMFLDVVAHDLKERSPQSLCAFMHMIKITHYVLAVHALEHGGGGDLLVEYCLSFSYYNAFR